MSIKSEMNAFLSLFSPLQTINQIRVCVFSITFIVVMPDRKINEGIINSYKRLDGVNLNK